MTPGFSKIPGENRRIPVSSVFRQVFFQQIDRRAGD
jgi:hypothetical protein